MKDLSWWYFQVCCNRLICLVVGHWNPVYFDRRKDPFHDAALTTSLESAERMYMVGHMILDALVALVSECFSAEFVLTTMIPDHLVELSMERFPKYQY